ncbi:unnamed protein product [Hymenolepis diminuta]|uniref:FH2 domain-containing protein n=1 Tax=Hymenolepis diminuta TaxID=6216 RepID=A0A0R3SCU4_HYMDI|nr:unnamed protein product [Hymenolepis diminuta]VUZ43217.1 unnamed protein product [Hymenolepis diminuta]
MTSEFTLFDGFDIPADIVRSANTQVKEHTKTAFAAFLQNLEQPLIHPVLSSLSSVVGLPCSTFLCRLTAKGEYYSGARNVDTVSVIKENLTILADPEAQEPSKTVDAEKHIFALRQLCELANTAGCANDFEEWSMHHSTELHNALISCLNSENPLIIEETVVTISFLARKLHFALLKSAETLITAMIAVLAVALTPTENHIESYRKAVDFHKELVMTKSRQITFHYPRQNYEFCEPKFRVIAYIYYALADFLCNVPHPFLIHYFQCRILRRKEETRRHLLHIIYAIVKNIIELEEFAKDVCPKLEKPQERSVDQIPLVKRTFKEVTNQIPQPKTIEKDNTETPENSTYKPEFYQKDQWSNLPLKLYSEMLRTSQERNQENMNLISNAMAELKSISSVKLPSVDLTGESINPNLIESVSRRIRIDIPRSAEGAQNVENDKTTSARENGKVNKSEEKEISKREYLANNGRRIVTESPPIMDRMKVGLVSDNSFDSDKYRNDSEFIQTPNRSTVLLQKPLKSSDLKFSSGAKL